MQHLKLHIGEDRIEYNIESTKFKTYVTPNETKGTNHLRVEPKIDIKNSLIYFEPSYFDLAVDGNCFPKLNFVATKGIIIEGSVSPAIEGVTIRATSDLQ